MLACSALALGNSFPLIPCRLADPGCTAHRQLASPGGLTDAIVASLAFLTLAFTPIPLWRRMRQLARWRRLRPVMTAARVICPACFFLMSIASIAGRAEGLAERIMVTSLVLWISALAITLITVSLHAQAYSVSGTGTTASAR